MNATASTLLLTAIGFIVGFGIPRKGTTSENPPGGRPRLSPRQLEPHESSSAVDRMRSLADRAANLTPAEWPPFFHARMNDPGGTRLLERLWAEQDPDGFWDWLKQQHDGTTLETYGRNLLRVWAATDPDAAIAAANSITNKKYSDLLRRDVIETVIADDLEKGLELAAAATDFNRFSWGEREWMKTDPSAATQGLAKLPQQSEYRDYLNYAVAEWAKQDSPALLAWLKTQSAFEREQWFGLAFKCAATIDVHTALETATNLKDPTARDDALAGVLASGKVATGEMKDLLSHLSLPKRAEATFAALQNMREPQQLADAVGLLSEAPASKRTLDAAASLFTRHNDWDQGLVLASSLPDSALRRKALASLAFSASPQQLDALAATVAHVPLLDLSNDLFKNVLKRLPEGQREAWLAKLPPDRAAWARATAQP